MQEPQTWRALLGKIITDQLEKERMASEIKVRSITLTRWASGESRPRPQNLRQLVNATPRQYRSQMSDLLEAEFPGLTYSEEEEGPDEIPYAFIMEVFDTRATTPDALRFWNLCRLILREALSELNSEDVGLALTVVRCMPPSEGGKILSLREAVGLGTPPWGSDLEQKALFLGAESLVGYSVTSCRPMPVNNLTKSSPLLPAYKVEHEMSAIAYPIMYASRVAGCLLVSCTQPGYFVPQSRIALIHGFTNLLSLAFEPDEFYRPDIIELRMMPSIQTQRQYFTSFRERVLDIMREAAASGHPLNNIEAEHEAWIQIEKILLQLPPEPREP